MIYPELQQFFTIMETNYFFISIFVGILSLAVYGKNYSETKDVGYSVLLATLMLASSLLFLNTLLSSETKITLSSVLMMGILMSITFLIITKRGNNK